MSNASQPASHPLVPAAAPRRLWPWIVGTAVIAALSSAWYCHHLWTTPVPPEVADQSSVMGEMIVIFLMGVGVIVCTLIGALAGWLVGLLVQRLRSSPQ